MAADREELSGRTALVTGGSRGIGRAICLRLAAAGARVAINYRQNRAAAEAVRDQIVGDGGEAVVVAGDVADPAEVAAMIETVEQALGPIELLVCNAGISLSGGPNPLAYENWRQVMTVNVDGTFLPVMAVKDGMMNRGFGRIVCIASIAGLRPRPQNVVYATSKAAVIAFVRNISGVLAPAVRINAVAPGLIETDMIAGMDPKRREGMISATPMERIGRPEEIAETVLFLLSERSSFTTGQTLVASGGRVTVP